MGSGAAGVGVGAAGTGSRMRKTRTTEWNPMSRAAARPGSAGQRWPAAATTATSAQAIEMVPENVIGLPFTFTDFWLRAFSPRPITW
jgi:hypothetical protein